MVVPLSTALCAQTLPLCLVIGGSLGARTINNCIQAGLETLEQSKVQVLWQTGKNFTPDTSKVSRAKAETFVFDMCTAYAAADIVVSRAGAISVSELCLLAKPCILVPSPNVSEDHQTKNAMALVNEDAAVLVKDVEANLQLVNHIVELAKDKKKQEKLSERIALLAKPEALSEIVNQIESAL